MKLQNEGFLNCVKSNLRKRKTYCEFKTGLNNFVELSQFNILSRQTKEDFMNSIVFFTNQKELWIFRWLNC